MPKTKRGFTLIEILIALSIVAVLVAIMSPNIARVRPDRYKALFIKAYTKTEIAVSNMVNDPEMYPTEYDSNGNLTKYGFSSTAAPVGSLSNIDNTSGQYKFAHFFAKEVGGTNSNGTVTTSDGLIYSITANYNVSSVTSSNASATAASITVQTKKDGETIKLGGITVTVSGGVSCNDSITSTDGKSRTCTKYLEDRYNLKLDN